MRGKKGEEHFDPLDPPRCRANKRRGRGTYANDRPPVLGVIGRASEQMRNEQLEYKEDDVEMNVSTLVIQMSFSLVLMPVWVATLTERDGDLRTALVNGQNGQVALGKARQPDID
jgi:hypothetical protein